MRFNSTHQCPLQCPIIDGDSGDQCKEESAEKRDFENKVTGSLSVASHRANPDPILKEIITQRFLEDRGHISVL